MPLVSTALGVVAVLHQYHNNYEDASADIFVVADGSYRASTVSSVNIFLMAVNASF